MVHVYHSHFGTSLTQGVGKSPADALPTTCDVGHLSIQTHPIQDGKPMDTAENFVVSTDTLMEKIKHSGMLSKNHTEQKVTAKVYST